MLEFPRHFLQDHPNRDVLRTGVFALAAFLAVRGPLLGGEDMMIEEFGEIAVLVNRQVVQLLEISRDLNRSGTGQAVAAIGAMDTDTRMINGLGFLDEFQFAGRKRVGQSSAGVV